MPLYANNSVISWLSVNIRRRRDRVGSAADVSGGSCLHGEEGVVSVEGRQESLGGIAGCRSAGAILQLGQAIFGQVPRQKGCGIVGNFSLACCTSSKIPSQPLARIDLPKSKRGKDRKQHHRETTRPLGSAAVVILAANGRIADQSLAVVVVQRNA